MNKQMQMTTVFKRSVIASALLVAMSQASAVTFNLCTGTTTKTMPDGTVITMWGYGDDAVTGCTVTVPGPQLIVPPGDTVLTVNLRNTLPEASSVMIPGLISATAPAPVFEDTDGSGRLRATSMVAVAAANSGTASYTFNAKPGTYLYQSGTHAAVQMQMGLYGAATVDSAVGVAYPGVSYDNEVVLMYSEIDPALHTAVATGNYGIAPYTSTINYAPKYFLINGEAYTTASADIPAGAAGQRTLLRLLNAGLESHFPTLVGSSLSLIAEYGNPYPYARDQFSTLLAAGMTQDAILAPTVNGRLPLFDRHLRLTNATASPGGLMSFLAIGAGGPPPPPPVVPTAVNDVASTAEDTAVAIDVAANDTAVNVATVTTTAPLNGTTVVDATTGVVTYTPNLNYSGADTFGYSIAATDGLSTVSATVNLTITAVNDAPVANTNAYTMTAGTTLNVAATGVLANDTDVDSAGLTAVLGTTTAGGALTLNADGSFSYTPNAATTTDSFTYVANDGVADSAPASVTITVNPAVNVAPVAVADFATVTRNVRTTNPKNFVTINLIANDTDANNNIDPASIQIRTNPRKGTVVVNGDGTVTYTPANGKTGADAFSYRVRDLGGLLSNTVTVRINIL